MLSSSLLHLETLIHFLNSYLYHVKNENCCSMRMNRLVNPGFKPRLCSTLAVLFLASHVSPLSFNSVASKRKKGNFCLFHNVREDQMKCIWKAIKQCKEILESYCITILFYFLGRVGLWSNGKFATCC